MKLVQSKHLQGSCSQHYKSKSHSNITKPIGSSLVKNKLKCRSKSAKVEARGPNTKSKGGIMSETQEGKETLSYTRRLQREEARQSHIMECAPVQLGTRADEGKANRDKNQQLNIKVEG